MKKNTELQPQQLMRINKEIYQNHVKRGSHTWLITVLRPLYGPFHKIYPWIANGSKLLDIGCGTGSFLLLADHLCHLSRGIGYDTNKKSIALARKVANNKCIKFEIGTLIPAETIASSTVITLIDLIHHMTSPEQSQLIDHLSQHMSPGSRLIIKDLDPKPDWRAVANRITDAISTGSKVNYIALDDLALKLKSKGFNIQYQKALPKHVWNHYLLVADLSE